MQLVMTLSVSIVYNILSTELHHQINMQTTTVVKLRWRIQEFSSGVGVGVQVSLTKKALTTVFFSPQLILQKWNGQFHRNLSFFKVPEGVRHFPGRGGGLTFSRVGGPIAYSL